uniref:Uncharacterized protein n=1 Tax=Anguilla anguilla TaxID=7936 RepID=A0A0E9V234_ANGAN
MLLFLKRKPCNNDIICFLVFCCNYFFKD